MDTRKKRLNMTVRRDLIERWSKVAKRFNMSKSAMLEQILEEMLPVLESEEVNTLVKEVFARAGRGMTEISKELEKLEERG